MSETDAALVTRLAAGDRSALGDLYDRYARPVYSLALRMLGDAQSAEDVTQEVFLRVWRQAARYDPQRGEAGTWILHIAYNLTVDALRARRRETALASPDGRAGFPAAPEEAALRSVLSLQVQEALGRLPPEQRQALEMAYFGARTHREIAAELRIPLGTVKSRLRLGLEALRAALLAPGPKGADDDERTRMFLH